MGGWPAVRGVNSVLILFAENINSLHIAPTVRALFNLMRQNPRMADEIFGQDIALNNEGQARVAANGELILTDGVDTGVQDIVLRIFTRLGQLFYDTEFGSLIHDWILEESTETTRAAFEAEIIMRVEMDPRVVVGSVRCSIVKWDERGITARAAWRFIDEDSPLNLVFSINKDNLEMIVEDVRPRANSFDMRGYSDA